MEGVEEKNNKGPKACTTCAKAKARCIPRHGDGDKCERCYRLNKDCASRSPAPPRMRKQPKRSKVAELEKRLNELSSQFDGGSKPMQVDESDPAVSPLVAPSRKRQIPINGLGFEHLFPKREPADETDDVPIDKQPEEGWGPWPWDSPWPLPSEAGVLLAHFQEHYAKLYPFVLIPEGITDTQLKEQRPFLWKAVMMISCFFDGARQVKLGREMLADVSRATVVEGQKSLDLLQGLQLLIAWFNYAVKSTQLTHLLFLARSLCVSLSSKNEWPLLQEDKSEDLELVRAYAGTYYLNTLVFTTNKKPDVFMNTAHLDQCCKRLEAAREYQSDEFVVKLVKIQQLAQTISLTMAFEPGQPAMQLPLTMVVQSFQEQLDSFRHSLPAHLKDDIVLDSHVAVAEVLLKEISLSDQHCNSAIMPLTDRLQLLYSCMRSLRHFHSARYGTLGQIDVPRFLGLEASDIAYTFIIGMRLVTLRLPGWNIDHIVTELRLGEIMDQQIEELVAAVERRRCGIFPLTGAAAMPLPPGATREGDPLERWIVLLKNVRALLRTEVEGKRVDKPEGAQVETTPMPMAPMGDMEEIWWGELMNDPVWDVNGDQMGFNGFWDQDL